MFDWITGIIESLSYWGVAFLMFLENVFPPLPSELIMPLGGFVASQGKMNFWGVIAAGTAGSLLGQLPLYYIGKTVGEKRLKEWSKKYGHWVAVSPDEIDTARDWFKRHGGATVFFCRLIPTIRSLISIPAGMSEMNLPLFLAYTLGGTVIWTTALAYAGRLLQDNYDKVDQYLNPVSYVVLALIIGLYLWRVVKRYREIHNSAEAT